MEGSYNLKSFVEKHVCKCHVGSQLSFCTDAVISSISLSKKTYSTRNALQMLSKVTQSTVTTQTTTKYYFFKNGQPFPFWVKYKTVRNHVN